MDTDIIQTIGEGFFHKKDKRNSSYTPYGFEKVKGSLFSAFKVTAKEIPFLIVAGILILSLIIGGLYELLFTTPLNKWFTESLNSILQLSPQSVINAPNQIPVNNLMQKTVGDWLGSIPFVWQPLISIVTAPVDVVLGVIIVILAVTFRLGRHLLGFIPALSSVKRGAESLSWTILALSLLPSALDFYIL